MTVERKGFVDLDTVAGSTIQSGDKWLLHRTDSVADVKECAVVHFEARKAMGTSGLDPLKVIVSDADGHADTSNVTTSDLANIAGGSSPFQDQIDGKAASSHTHDAAATTTGVFDPARIPILFTGVQVVSTGAIADLDSGQQATITAGAIVTTTDGRRWVYKGSGSKTSEASYIECADVTPDWSVIANKPSFATVATSGAYSDLSGTPTLGTVASLTADTDVTLAANSDTRVATQKAVKAYVDSAVVGGSGDVVGPASAVDSNLAAFDTTTGKLIKDAGVPVSSLVPTSYLDTDGTLAANSDTKIATQKATKTAIDAGVTAAAASASAAASDAASAASDASSAASSASAAASSAATAATDAGNASTSASSAASSASAAASSAASASSDAATAAAAASSAVAANSAISPGTKTKITYDAKGLVTAGVDATTADIADSSDARYVTDAQRTVLSNTSGTNTGDQDLSGLVPKTTTVNGQALSGNVTVSKSDVGLGSVTNDAQIPLAYLDTDGTLAADSDTKVPSQKAVNTKIAQVVAAADAWVAKGGIDCSGNPNYPAGEAGWSYRVTVAGKIGGASGPNVQVNDIITCWADSTASGDHATVGSSWGVQQVNIDGAVTNTSSAASGNFAAFDGTSGVVIEDSGYGPSSFAAALGGDDNYVTDAEKTKLSNLSGTNTGDQTNITGNAGTSTALQNARTIDGVSFNGTANITVIAPAINAATGKTTPVDADEIGLVDSAASNVLKKLTWANLKATIKTYFDTLYQPINAFRAGITDAATGRTALALGTAAQSAATDFAQLAQTSLTYAGTTGIDMSAGQVRTLSLTGNVTFTTSNRAAPRSVTLKITCDATPRTYTFPGWVFIGAAAPTGIPASKVGILSLTCFGTADSDIIAVYVEQP